MPRLSLQSPQLADVRTMLSSNFESPLLDEATLAQSWGDPLVSQWLSGSTPAIGRLFTENAIACFRNVQARVGMDVGIPTGLLGAFAQSLADSAAKQGAEKWVAIAQGTSTAIIDAAMAAASEIPMVGFACKLALGIAKLAQALAKEKQPRPPLLRYVKATDDSAAREALKLIESGDWTRLYLPPTSGRWDIKVSGDGGLRAMGLEPGDGMGCIPSGLFGSRVIQVRNAEAGLDRFSKKKPMTDWYYANVHDAFDLLPSLSRIGQAAWSAAGSSSTAAVYNMNYNTIDSAWRSYSIAALEEAEAWIKAGKHEDWRGKAAYATWFPGAAVKHGITHANYVGGKLLKTGRASIDNGPRTAGDVAVALCDAFQKRAIAMCSTSVCAYASKKQPWFQAFPDHMAQLEAGRKLLLQHPKVKTIDPDDVPDRNFRWEIEARGGGTQPSLKEPFALKAGANVPQRMPTPGMAGSIGGGDDDGGGLAIALLAGAALLFGV